MAATVTLNWTPERLNAVRDALAGFPVPDIPQALRDLHRYTAQAPSVAAPAPSGTTADVDRAVPATCTLRLDWTASLIHQVCQALCHALDAMEDDLTATGEHTGQRSGKALAADQAHVWAAHQDLQDVMAAQRWTGVNQEITP